MTVTLPADVVWRYPRFSLYNSPYPAHDHGCAIDLYPEGDVAPSPVAGVVRETRTVGCPDRPYATAEDHLIVVDVDDDWAAEAGVDDGLTARVLHVEPDVTPGDPVAVGETLGPMVRSGFFGQWVGRHVHLGFRRRNVNAMRASGSLPLDPGVEVEPVRWDGTGVVVETGPSHAVLDAPDRPSSGTTYAALASDGGIPLDGGLAHYAGGGAFGGPDGPVSLLGQQVGVAEGRTVAWGPVDVLANGEPITGLSLFVTREAGAGVKLVCPGQEFGVGDSVAVSIRPSDDPADLSVGR